MNMVQKNNWTSRFCRVQQKTYCSLIIYQPPSKETKEPKPAEEISTIQEPATKKRVKELSPVRTHEIHEVDTGLSESPIIELSPKHRKKGKGLQMYFHSDR